VVGDVVEPDRRRLVDQQAEDPPAARQVADGGVRLGLLARRQELRQAAALLVEDAHRGELRAAQLAPGLQDPFEEDVEVELRGQRPADGEQVAQAIGAQGAVVVARVSCLDGDRDARTIRRGLTGSQAGGAFKGVRWDG
jgi:hypothetical protein